MLSFLRPGSIAILFALLAALQTEQTPRLAASDIDFEARCRAPGVIRCVGFDSPESVKGHLDPAWDGVYRSEIVTDVAASGGGSLRFTVPPFSPANSSGEYWLEFADDLSVQFGSGEEFYVQWRQRFSPEMLKTLFKDGNGWKQAIIGEGSRPGHTAYSCTDIHLVVEDTGQHGMPRMYHSCGYKDGEYQGLEVYAPHLQTMLLQNAVGCPYSRITFPPCVGYKADEWMSFQVHVKVGTWYRNDKRYRHDSLVQLWVGEPGKPAVLVIDMNPQKGTGYDLANPDPDHIKYGKVWLLPYHTNKNKNQNHVTAYTWYDELIISRNRIPDPK
jgi:hypothetical protein